MFIKAPESVSAWLALHSLPSRRAPASPAPPLGWLLFLILHFTPSMLSPQRSLPSLPGLSGSFPKHVLSVAHHRPVHFLQSTEQVEKGASESGSFLTDWSCPSLAATLLEGRESLFHMSLYTQSLTQKMLNSYLVSKSVYAKEGLQCPTHG